MPTPTDATRSYTMHVISHTHWDREWYQDFQGYRKRLVFQMDALLDLLEAQPDFAGFHLDGQTACLFDYLEIRPEQRARLTRHLQTGRITIGPWFVMPDEFVVSGESLVRNFLLGHQHCAEFGVPAVKMGYVTDIFGHCSQLPQILRGFGIDSAMLHRGTSCEDEHSEMVWEGADGSAVLLVKVYYGTGYNDFIFMRWFNWDDERIREYEQDKIRLATTPVLYALDGNDHEPARRETLYEVQRVHGVMTDTRVMHSTLPAYLQELWAALGDDWQRGRRRFVGELRTPAKVGQWNEVWNGCSSGRMPLKRTNDQIEWLLARGAEPLQAWLRLLGADDQQAYLRHAWQHLITNHPHDSIVGCSVDQVHHDMQYRFDQARLIGEQAVGEALTELSRRLDLCAFGVGARVTTLVNMATLPTGPVTAFSCEVPAGEFDQAEVDGKHPIFFDENDAPVPCVITRIERGARIWPVMQKEYQPSAFYRSRDGFHNPQHHRIHLLARCTVPALGYQTLRLGWTTELPVTTNGVIADGNRLENAHLTLTVGADGRVTLQDHETAQTYTDLLSFEDCGDIGEGWNHRYPARDRRVLSTDDEARGPVTIEAQQMGALAASLTVRFTLRVPADIVRGEDGQSERSADTVPLEIATCFTLLADAHRVDCRTTVQNTASRHRLRVLLPTGRQSESWLGDTAFDVVTRPVKVLDTAGWKEQAREEGPIKNVVAIQDERGGLAVLSRGPLEACVQDKPERPIALTLFRGFLETLIHEATRDSQLLGEVVIEYALLPFAHQGARIGGFLMQEVDRYKAPRYDITGIVGEVGSLPAQGQFVEVPAPLALSTIKLSEDRHALILRLFNPQTDPVSSVVHLHVPFYHASLANMLEEPEALIILTPDRGIPLTVGPKQVVTVRVATMLG